MGKVLKIVGTILAVAAATIFTAGGLGIVTLVAGEGLALAATIAVVAGTAFTAIGAALQAGNLNSLEETGANQRGQPFLNPNAYGSFIFGLTAVPFALVYEKAFGTNLEQVSAVYAHAWHEINSYQKLYIDGTEVTFTGDLADAPYDNGILKWQRKDGSQTTSITLGVVGWTSAAKFLGVAHSALEWDLGNNQTVLTSGIPSNVVGEIEGALLYDPRLDPTYGTGTQDFADPSTWTYQRGNPALVLLRYCIGEFAAGGEKIWGVGELEGDIDMAAFITAADVADEAVPSETPPRFRIEGEFQTNNDHDQFFTQWEQSTGGRIVRRGGKRMCWLPSDDLTSVATFTDANIIGKVGVGFAMGVDVRNLVNAARGRYISAADRYEGVPYPEVTESAFETADGMRRTLPLDLGWVQDVEIAERVARINVRRTRFGRVWVFAVGWEGILRHLFDVVTLNTLETNDTAQLCRIIDKELQPNGIFILTVQEEDADIYADVTAGTPAVVTAAPTTVAPADLLLFEPNSTAGAAGTGGHTMPGPGGQTSILIERNKNADGTGNDGEIKIDDGWLLMPDDTIRAVAAGSADFAEDLFTFYEAATAAATPRDGVFYIISGDPTGTLPRSRFTTMTAGAAGSWGSAEDPAGFFIAEFDRSSGTWYAQNNLDEEEAFTPLITDMVFAQGKKALASTSIDFVQLLVQRAAVVARQQTPRSLRNDMDMLDDTVGKRKPIPVGYWEEAVADGGSVTFPNTGYSTPPVILWGEGGIYEDSAITETHRYGRYVTQSLNAAGFTAQLDLVADDGGSSFDYSVGPQTTENGSGPDPLWQLTKDDATSTPGGGSPDTHEGDGGSYLFQFDCDAVDCESPPGEPHNGRCKVGLYSLKSGGSWTLKATKDHNSGTFNNSTQSMVSTGLNTAGPTNVDKFGIDEEIVTGVCSSNGITRFDLVTWTRTPVQEAPATPGTVPAVKFKAVTNVQ